MNWRGAQRDAYARAEACFARAIADGKRVWRASTVDAFIRLNASTLNWMRRLPNSTAVAQVVENPQALK